MLVINGPVTKDTSTNDKFFNPFHDAENSDSDRQQQPPITVKQFVAGYTSKQFESIFYRLPKEKINLCRMNSRLHTIYVVSRKQPNQNKFSAEIRDYLKNLRCSACWVVEGPLVGNYSDGNIKYLPVYSKADQPKKGLLQDYQEKLDQLLPQNSICLVIDVSLVPLKLTSTFNGLLLGRLTAEETELLKVADLQHIRCVSFTHVKDMKQFFEVVGGGAIGSEQHLHLQNHIDDKLNLTMKEEGNEAIQFLLYEMQQQLEILSPSKLRLVPPVNLAELDKAISDRHTGLFIVDLNVIEKSQQPKQMIKKLKQVSKFEGRFVVVLANRPREQVETNFPQLLQSKIVVIAGDGTQVRLNNTWIKVLERHERNLGVLRNKFKEYLQCYGGSQLENAESLFYSNESQQIIKKVYREVKDMLNDERYLRLSCTQTTVRVSWRLKENRASLEAIVQLRCMVQGSLQFICVLVDDQKKECIFDDMDNLAKAFPSYFKENLVRQYLLDAPRPSELANGYLTNEQLSSFMFGLL